MQSNHINLFFLSATEDKFWKNHIYVQYLLRRLPALSIYQVECKNYSAVQKGDIVLVVLSPNSCNPQFIAQAHIQEALAHYQKANCAFYGVVVSSCDSSAWGKMPLLPLNPTNAQLKPLSEWDSHTVACAQIVDYMAEQLAHIRAIRTEQERRLTERLPKMIRIEGGSFEMGGMRPDGRRYGSELPAHTVRLSSYELANQVVSFDQYALYCEVTGKALPFDEGWGKGNQPLIHVNWYEAIEYCNWLSEQVGLEPCYLIDKSRKDPNNPDAYDEWQWVVKCNFDALGYRLPTEAEWEYAARERGKAVRFGNGKQVANPLEINFNALARHTKPYSIEGIYRAHSVPTDSFEPNALGLYQMSGNVWEWCWDWHDLKYYKGGAMENPTGGNSGIGRVMRGGSMFSIPDSLCTTNRSSHLPFNGKHHIGFRLARKIWR